MEAINRTTNQIMGNQVSQNHSMQRSAQSTQVVSSADPTADERKDMATALAACMVVQRTYGKQGVDLPATLQIFLQDLAEYPVPKIIGAINYWRKKSPEFPTPANIESILNPEPIRDKAVYIELLRKRKAGEQLSTNERRYIMAYEESTISGEL